ncbi:ras-GEF domain-containing family member 1B [Teleopsis dalmanni]|uniref:ras-GEF domain-containing family member 1B n=1 Tax=Teleopsis dalmanni TaxID=139649 RepID=UPI000D32966B|nr:ras-GEF domain-containing family member 1B [Teleopsis dalmanni]
MLPMSNNDINNASNGRNSANSTSISHKKDIKATKPPLPEKPAASLIASKCNNNDSRNKIISAHRRDNSNSSVKPHPDKGENRSTQYIKTQTYFKQIREGASAEQCRPDDVELHTVVYSDGHLTSGTLEALIEHMVPTSEYYPERTYIFSFLLSARLFIRPHELLSRISQTWDQQQQKISNDVVDEANFSHLMMAASVSPLMQRKASVNEVIAATTITEAAQKAQRTGTQKSAQHCIRLLSEWIETFPYDFRDERLMQQVRILARKCVYIDNALGKQVSRILQLLVQRLTALEKYEEFLQSLVATDLNASQHYSTSAAAAYAATNATNNSLGKSTAAGANNADNHKTMQPSMSVATNSNTAIPIDGQTHEVYGLMDLCPSCAQLAHQLTAIELERLSHIGPEEFVQAFAKEYQHTIENKPGAGSNAMSTSLNDMKKTRNLESYVEWFNRLSYLTASEIVKYPKKKQRVRVIEYWIETARECFNIGNFNSLMAIIAGLNLAPISRLKKTWSKVQSAKFSVLEHQMDPTSNFNSYRSTLKAAMWRSEGATEERERIIIPFFSLFVKDLYFLNEGCSNRLPNNHINFEKCSQLAKQVMEFNEWKKVNCPFEKLPNVITFLQTSPVLNENTLSIASFECEPPENTEEKGRYKTVKAETKQQLLQQLQEQQQL